MTPENHCVRSYCNEKLNRKNYIEWTGLQRLECQLNKHCASPAEAVQLLKDSDFIECNVLKCFVGYLHGSLASSDLLKPHT